MAGRPTKLKKETTEKILKLIRMGNYRETACAAAGVNARTMRNWLQWGADGEPGYAEFAEAMEEAESQAEAGLLMGIRQSTDWKAHAFILARRFGKNWTEKTET